MEQPRCKASMGETLEKIEPTAGVSNTRLRNKFAKGELDDITRDQKYWITGIKLLIGVLKYIDVHIYDTGMMNHILPGLPKAYDNIIAFRRKNG